MMLSEAKPDGTHNRFRRRSLPSFENVHICVKGGIYTFRCAMMKKDAAFTAGHTEREREQHVVHFAVVELFGFGRCMRWI